MSGTFPTTRAPSTLEIKEIQGSVMSENETFGRQSRLLPGAHRFIFDASWVNLSDSERRKIVGFLASQRGSHDSFSLPFFSMGYPANGGALNIATSVTPTTSYAAGFSIIATEGWTPSITNQILSGDLLKFDNHAKIYKCVVDKDSDVSGNIALTIIPELKVSITGTTTLLFSGFGANVYAPDVNTWKGRPPSLWNINATFLEDV